METNLMKSTMDHEMERMGFFAEVYFGKQMVFGQYNEKPLYENLHKEEWW